MSSFPLLGAYVPHTASHSLPLPTACFLELLSGGQYLVIVVGCWPGLHWSPAQSLCHGQLCQLPKKQDVLRLLAWLREGHVIFLNEIGFKLCLWLGFFMPGFSRLLYPIMSDKGSISQLLLAPTVVSFIWIIKSYEVLKSII